MTVTKLLTSTLIVALVLGIYYSLFTKPQEVTPLFLEDSTAQYQLHYHQKIFDFSLQDRPKPTHVWLESTLVFQVQKIDTKGADVLMKLQDITLRLEPSNDVLSQALTDYYSREVAVRYSLEGEVLEMNFPGNERNYVGYRQLLKQLEVIVKDKTTYKIVQEDGLGRCEMVYTHQGLEVKREKEQYISSEDGSSVRIYHSLAKVQLDSSLSWYKGFSFKERVRLSKDGKKVLQVESNIDLTLQKSRALEKINLDPILFQKQQEEDVDIYQKIEDDQVQQFFDAQGYTFNSLVERVLHTPDSIEALNLLERYLQLHPEEIEKLQEHFYGMDNRSARNIISVLENLQLPASQQLLVAFTEDEQMMQMNRIRSVIALSGQDTLSDEGVEALSRLHERHEDGAAQERSDTALLALGNVGRKSKHTEEMVQPLIINALNSAQTYAEAKVAILAAKNGGVEPYIEALIPYLQSQDDRLRERVLTLLAPYCKENNVGMAIELQSVQERQESLKKQFQKVHLNCI